MRQTPFGGRSQVEHQHRATLRDAFHQLRSCRFEDLRCDDAMLFVITTQHCQLQ